MLQYSSCMINDFLKCICCGSENISEATTTSFFDLPVKKCNSCNYHFLAFNKNEFDIKKYYSDTYWPVFRNLHNEKKLAGKVDSVYLVKKLPKPLQKIIEFTGVRKSLAFSQFNYLKSYINGKKILEIGSGEGFLLEFLEKNGYDVFGVEPSKDNLPIIKKKLKTGKCITGYVEDAYNINEKFDVIILSHVLEHFIDCKQPLVELKKHLENDGIIFLEVPNCQNLKTLNHSIYTQPHIHHFSANNLEMLVKSCGYIVINKSVFLSNVITIFQHVDYLVKWLLRRDHYKPTDEFNGNNLRMILKIASTK